MFDSYVYSIVDRQSRAARVCRLHYTIFYTLRSHARTKPAIHHKRNCCNVVLNNGNSGIKYVSNENKIAFKVVPYE